MAQTVKEIRVSNPKLFGPPDTLIYDELMSPQVLGKALIRNVTCPAAKMHEEGV